MYLHASRMHELVLGPAGTHSDEVFAQFWPQHPFSIHCIVHSARSKPSIICLSSPLRYPAIVSPRYSAVKQGSTAASCRPFQPVVRWDDRRLTHYLRVSQRARTESGKALLPSRSPFRVLLRAVCVLCRCGAQARTAVIVECFMSCSKRNRKHDIEAASRHERPGV